MISLVELCYCGCIYRQHCQTPPHRCIHEFDAWWPELIPAGFTISQNHCEGFRPQNA